MSQNTSSAHHSSHFFSSGRWFVCELVHTISNMAKQWYLNTHIKSRRSLTSRPCRVASVLVSMSYMPPLCSCWRTWIMARVWQLRQSLSLEGKLTWHWGLPSMWRTLLVGQWLTKVMAEYHDILRRSFFNFLGNAFAIAVTADVDKCCTPNHPKLADFCQLIPHRARVRARCVVSVLRVILDFMVHGDFCQMCLTGSFKTFPSQSCWLTGGSSLEAGDTPLAGERTHRGGASFPERVSLAVFTSQSSREGHFSSMLLPAELELFLSKLAS